MTEVMLEMVTLGLKGVEVFVFDFPPTATGINELGDVVIGNQMVGDDGCAKTIGRRSHEGSITSARKLFSAMGNTTFSFQPRDS